MAKKKIQKHTIKKKAVKVISKKPAKILKLQKVNAKVTAKKIISPESDTQKKLIQERQKLEQKRLGVILSNAGARQYLVDLAGENTLAILKNFSMSTSDEELSKNLKLKISDVRATLNKLHGVGLVNYLREKDSETGWFSYSWSLNGGKIEQWIKDKVAQKQAALSLSGDNYYCSNCGLESVLSFELASNTEFKCIKCERKLDFLDDITKLEELKILI